MAQKFRDAFGAPKFLTHIIIIPGGLTPRTPWDAFGAPKFLTHIIIIPGGYTVDYYVDTCFPVQKYLHRETTNSLIINDLAASYFAAWRAQLMPSRAEETMPPA